MSAALRAEWTKLCTQTTTPWLLLGVPVTTIGVGALAGAVTHQSGVVQGGDATRLSLTGIYLGQLVIAALAVSTITEEYASGLIRVTFSALPRRLPVLAAKALSLGALAVLVGLFAAPGCLLVGGLLLPAAGFDPAHGYALIAFGSAATLRAAVGTVIYLTLIALLSLGLATLIRDTAVAIGAVVAVLFGPPLLAQIVGGTLGRELKRFAPMSAGLSIQHTTGLRTLPIQPWPGLAVTAGWAALALALAALMLCRRDA